MAPGPTVYVVDDNRTIRNWLEETLKTENLIVESYASAEDFLVTYSPDNPGCLLLDIVMPGMDGLELQKVLTAQGNQTPIIFLTGKAKVHMAVDAMKAGAVEFIEKPVQLDVLLNYVNKAMRLDLRNRHEQLQRSQIEQRMMLLTPRECEVLEWLIQGKSNKMIARILGISSRTIEIHRKNIIDKMQANSVVDLVKMVMAVRT